jgi:peroxiredoxin
LGANELQLSDNFGKTKTILLFVPLAFTGVCTTELCDVSASMSYYASLNAVVYGISVDSPFAQEAWAKQSHIAIPLLSDFNKVGHPKALSSCFH